MLLKAIVWSAGQRGLGGRIKEILSVVWVRADGGLGRMVAEEVERGDQVLDTF